MRETYGYQNEEALLQMLRIGNQSLNNQKRKLRNLISLEIRMRIMKARILQLDSYLIKAFVKERLPQWLL